MANCCCCYAATSDSFCKWSICLTILQYSSLTNTYSAALDRWTEFKLARQFPNLLFSVFVHYYKHTHNFPLTPSPSHAHTQTQRVVNSRAQFRPCQGLETWPQFWSGLRLADISLSVWASWYRLVKASATHALTTLQPLSRNLNTPPGFFNLKLSTTVIAHYLKCPWRGLHLQHVTDWESDPAYTAFWLIAQLDGVQTWLWWLLIFLCFLFSLLCV